MSTKEQILQKLDKITDEAILANVLSNIELEVSLGQQPLELNPTMEKELQEAIDDVDQGRVHTHEQAQKAIKQWLKEQ